jgi:hypothetical protein
MPTQQEINTNLQGQIDELKRQNDSLKGQIQVLQNPNKIEMYEDVKFYPQLKVDDLRPIQITFSDEIGDEYIFYISKRVGFSGIEYEGGSLYVNGEVVADSFKINQTPTAGVLVPDKYITIDCNGTTYKIPVKQ